MATTKNVKAVTASAPTTEAGAVVGTPHAPTSRSTSSAAPSSGFRRTLGNLSSAMEQGRSRLDRLDAALGRLAANPPTVTQMRRRVEALREDLDRLRAGTLKRMDETPATLIVAAANAAHSGLRGASSELHSLAERLKNAAVPRKDGGT
jgi:hypothetical protein